MQTPEADFEERFLYDFHERVACAAVCRPARMHLWEHLMQALANFGTRRLAYGASTLGVGVLAMGYVIMPGQETQPAGLAGAALSRFDSSISSLTPGLSRDYDSCTSIRVVKTKNPFAHESSLAARVSSPGENVNAYTSSTAREASAWEAAVRNSAEETENIFAF